MSVFLFSFGFEKLTIHVQSFFDDLTGEILVIHDTSLCHSLLQTRTWTLNFHFLIILLCSHI